MINRSEYFVNDFFKKKVAFYYSVSLIFCCGLIVLYAKIGDDMAYGCRTVIFYATLSTLGIRF